MGLRSMIPAFFIECIDDLGPQLWFTEQQLFFSRYGLVLRCPSFALASEAYVHYHLGILCNALAFLKDPGVARILANNMNS
jgi:hypothetical protein